MGWFDVVLLCYLMPPLAEFAAIYWVRLFRQYGGELAGRMKRGQRRRPTVYWPD